MRSLIDSRNLGTVYEALANTLARRCEVRLLTQDFSLAAYQNLERNLKSVNTATIILPGSMREDGTWDARINLAGDATERRFRDTLLLPAVAKRLSDWIAHMTEVKLSATPITQNLLHLHFNDADDSVIHGSSPFTAGGLGLVPTDGCHMNTYADDRKETEALREWFDRIWSSRRGLVEGKDRLLREALAKTIAGSNPDRPNAITEDEYRACRRFMSHFDSYYTLNYDLLLYWASRQDDVDELKLKYNDGFHHPESGKAEYVVWDMTDVAGQNAFYLHGGLHFFDAGHEVHKYTWVNSGIPLIDQIREALSMNKFPIYVAEGNSESKRERVQHSAFLSRGYRSLAERRGSIFVYGVSFSPNDQHILRLIERNKTRQVFVSVYGDPTRQENQELMSRAMQLESGREDSPRQVPLTVRFFDAAGAQVWG